MPYLVPLLRRPLGPVCNLANGGLDPVATWVSVIQWERNPCYGSSSSLWPPLLPPPHDGGAERTVDALLLTVSSSGADHQLSFISSVFLKLLTENPVMQIKRYDNRRTLLLGINKHLEKYVWENKISWYWGSKNVPCHSSGWDEGHTDKANCLGHRYRYQYFSQGHTATGKVS